MMHERMKIIYNVVLVLRGKNLQLETLGSNGSPLNTSSASCRDTQQFHFVFAFAYHFLTLLAFPVKQVHFIYSHITQHDDAFLIKCVSLKCLANVYIFLQIRFMV